jgi:hypothetical protein
MRGYLGEAVIGEVKGPDAALRFIRAYGQIDGDHHKAWVLDQVARVLLGTPVILKEAKWENGEREIRFKTGEPSRKYIKWASLMASDGHGYDVGIPP